ncbi:MAG: ATP-binding protein [Candidatus Thorarchaeota archaeon]
MNEQNNKPFYKSGKIIWLILLVGFIIISAIFLFNLEFIRLAIGFSVNFDYNPMQIFKILLIILCSVVSLIASFYFCILIFNSLPIKGDFTQPNILLQKKMIIPKFRVSMLIKVKGIPRNALKRTNSNNELLSNSHLDIISSLSQICEEVSYWIVKRGNKIQIFFTISGWSWFSKDRAIQKAKQSTYSLESSFKNIYPSILFEDASLEDSNLLIEVINNCHYGIESKGIPALKIEQTQIDRLINTFDNLNEDCFFVVSLNKIKRGQEKNHSSKNIFTKLEMEEYKEDYIESKKTGQSKVGLYSFSKNEKGMNIILAALLSIWSGTHTFEVDILGDCKNSSKYKAIKNINPITNTRMSNKVISSLIQLPEKPFLTEDTGKPVFEIPDKGDYIDEMDIVLGNIIQNEKTLDEFSLPLENFLYNTEIVGMIGRGKTFLTATIIEQLIDMEMGCLIFDLKGEYAKLFINEPSVVVYTIGDPAPIGINLFNINSENEAQNVLSLISEMLTIAGIPFSPTMLNIFENALQKIVLEQKKDFEQFMYCLSMSSEEYSNSMKTSYSRESIDAILNRLNYIFGGVNYDVFSVRENTIDLEDLDKGYKIILDLSEYLRRGASTASLFLVCNFILHLLSKYASQKGITNKLRYLVILEEAMYLIPKRYNLESAASLGYSEQNFIMGRSLGIGTISIYQLWDSVSPVVHANSLTKILFRGEDIENIKESVVLSDEQLNYLPFLPDRNFIIKSKTLSGPALMKTRNFNRFPINDNEFRKIAAYKFEKKGLQYLKISKSLIEIRKIVFEKEKYTDFTSTRTNDSSQIINQKNHSSKPKLTKYIDLQTDFNKSWEYCINFCPARFIYKNKHSNWIKEEICSDILNKSNEITQKLLSTSNIEPLFNIIQKNPDYLVQKIVKHYTNQEENEISNVIAFCTMNFILDKLTNKFDKDIKWKTGILNQIRRTLVEKHFSRELNSELNQ